MNQEFITEEYKPAEEQNKIQSRKPISWFCSGWLPFAFALAAALALSVEYVLDEFGLGGLCPTAGCKTVGGFVRHGESMFLALGMLFFWSLAGLFFFSIRLRNSFLRNASLVLIAAGLAFDGGIISFQTFAVRESCILCYGVGAALFLTLAAFGLHRRSIFVLTLGLSIWSAGFLSQAFFLFPGRVPDLDETVLAFSQGKKQAPLFYYFFSLRCPYCSDVLKKLQHGATGSGTWLFCPLASRSEDKRKLSSLLEDPVFNDNPFAAVLKAEHAAESETEISPAVERATRAAMAFMRNSGYRGVPLLISHERRGKMVVLAGRDEILKYLLENNHVILRKQVGASNNRG
jgi:hypothetical protein